MHTMNDGVNGGSSGTNGHTLSKDIPLEAKLQVVKSEKAFASYAKSLVARPAGSVFSLIEGATPAKKAYTSVQTGEDSHIELNSDLVYCNHSCDPSVVFDMSKMEVRVVDHRDLQAGDALTFFYPSSEWDMAQPFTCECKSENCCGTIDGARNMDKSILQRYWLNPHIERLLAGAAQS